MGELGMWVLIGVVVVLGVAAVIYLVAWPWVLIAQLAWEDYKRPKQPDPPPPTPAQREAMKEMHLPGPLARLPRWAVVLGTITLAAISIYFIEKYDLLD